MTWTKEPTLKNGLKISVLFAVVVSLLMGLAVQCGVEIPPNVTESLFPIFTILFFLLIALLYLTSFFLAAFIMAPLILFAMFLPTLLMAYFFSLTIIWPLFIAYHVWRSRIDMPLYAIIFFIVGILFFTPIVISTVVYNSRLKTVQSIKD